MKVFTYYANTGNNPENDTKLLLLWARNWKFYGHEPVVLNEAIARQHPRYQEMKARTETFPSVNPPAYEWACYCRWLAYAVAGGGLCVDWDLFIYDMAYEFGSTPSKLESLQGHVPSIVHGNQRAMESVIGDIIDYKVTSKDIEDRRQPHVSDMYMFYRNGIDYTPRMVARNWGEAHWKKAPFVHYAHAVMTPGKRTPRHLYIPDLRPWVITTEEK